MRRPRRRGEASCFMSSQKLSALKSAPLLAVNEATVIEADGAEVADTLAGGVMEEYGVLDFGRHPHPAAGTMLLEMDLVEGPKLDAGFAHQARDQAEGARAHRALAHQADIAGSLPQDLVDLQRCRPRGWWRAILFNGGIRFRRLGIALMVYSYRRRPRPASVAPAIPFHQRKVCAHKFQRGSSRVTSTAQRRNR